MVVAQAEAGCATAGEASEILLNTLADRLQGFEPARFLDSMDARAFRRAGRASVGRALDWRSMKLACTSTVNRCVAIGLCSFNQALPVPRHPIRAAG